MSALSSLKSAVGGVCLLIAATAGAGASDIESQLIALPLPQPVETIDPSDTCVGPDAVLLQLEGEMVELGGRAMTVDGAIDQSISDEWRRRTHVDSVPIGLILVHLFADPKGSDELVVDTVEFDISGCAMSRTLIPLGAWSSLLRAAAGDPA